MRTTDRSRAVPQNLFGVVKTGARALEGDARLARAPSMTSVRDEPPVRRKVGATPASLTLRSWIGPAAE